MADYIYLLEHRLNAAQRSALRAVREAVRLRGLTVFLVGGAVRDLTSGSPVRDLDVVVQGNALKLKKDLEKAGAVVTGEQEAGQALFLRFPGSVRLEFGSTLSVSYPKPGKAVVRPANILDDLRRRDFTANAMALSLNEGSYGLLMDPLNGVADIDNRQLRLVSNYGFIEDPVRMIRAARLMARLGWDLDEKTRARYETGKKEGYISALSDFQRGYETEEIAHEEDPVRVLRRLETEGWMKYLAPFWGASKVNVPELERLREVQTQLQVQGLQPDTAAASFPLLTAKLSAKEIESLKASFPRQGFVSEIESLEAEGKEFAAQLSGKASAQPSQAWKLITQARPEVVLWAEFSTRSPALQAKFKSFHTEWPQARTRMPYTLMQEMRIVPEIPGYEALLEQLFFELMDGRLTTPEEMKAYLEPHSPPAPPPPVTLRRMRAAKKEARPAKSRAKKAAKVDAGEEEVSADAEPALTPKPAEPVARPKAPVAAEADASAAEPAAAAKGKAVRSEAPVPAKAPSMVSPKPPVKAAAAPAKTAGKSSPPAAPAPPVKAAAKAAKSAALAKAAAPAKAAPAKKSAAPVKTAPAKGPAAAPQSAGSPARAAQKQTPVKGAVSKPAAAKSGTNAVTAKPPAKKSTPVPAKAAPAAAKKSGPAGKAPGSGSSTGGKAVPAKAATRP